MQAELAEVEKKLQGVAPLVFAGECRQLHEHLGTQISGGHLMKSPPKYFHVCRPSIWSVKLLIAFSVSAWVLRLTKRGCVFMFSNTAKAAMGQAFLLMGGDCAESFKEFHVDTVC